MSSLLSPNTKRAYRNGCKRASPSDGIFNHSERKVIKLEGSSYSVSNAAPHDGKATLLGMEEASLKHIGSFLNFVEVYQFGVAAKNFHVIEVGFNGHLTSSVFAYDNPNTMYRRLLRDPAETRCIEHMKELSPRAFDALASASNELGRMAIFASGSLALQAVLNEKYPNSDGDFYITENATLPVRDYLVEQGFVLTGATKNYFKNQLGINPGLSNSIVRVERYALPSENANYTRPPIGAPTVRSRRCDLIVMSNGAQVPFDRNMMQELGASQITEKVDIVVTRSPLCTIKDFDLTIVTNAIDMCGEGTRHSNRLFIGHPEKTFSKVMDFNHNLRNKKTLGYMTFLIKNHQKYAERHIMSTLLIGLPPLVFVPAIYRESILNAISSQQEFGGIFSTVFDEPSDEAFRPLLLTLGDINFIPPSAQGPIIQYLVVKSLKCQLISDAVTKFSPASFLRRNTENPLRAHDCSIAVYRRVVKYSERNFDPTGRLGAVFANVERKISDNIFRVLDSKSDCQSMVETFLRSARVPTTSESVIGGMLRRVSLAVSHETEVLHANESIIEKSLRLQLIEELIGQREMFQSRHCPIHPGYTGGLLLTPSFKVVLQHQDATVDGLPLSHYCDMFDDCTLRTHFGLADLMYLKLMYLRVEHVYESKVINSNHVLNVETGTTAVPWQAPVPIDWILHTNAEHANASLGQSTLQMHFGVVSTGCDRAGSPQPVENDEHPMNVVSPNPV